MIETRNRGEGQEERREHDGVETKASTPAASGTTDVKNGAWRRCLDLCAREVFRVNSRFFGNKKKEEKLLLSEHCSI